MEFSSWESFSESEFRSSTPGLLTSDDEMDYVVPSFPIDPSALPKSTCAARNRTNARLVRSGVSRDLGKRKQRRFENDMMLLIPLDEECEMMFAEEPISGQVEELYACLRRQDPDQYEAFVQGEEILASFHHKERAHGGGSTRQGLFRIDKRIRKHMLRHTQFVLSLDQYLMDQIRAHSKDQTHCPGELRLALPMENSFHRLLAHGVAQFYGFNSGSKDATIHLSIPLHELDAEHQGMLSKLLTQS